MKIIHRTDTPGVVEIAWSNGDRTYGAPSRRNVWRFVLRRRGEAVWHFVFREYISRVRRRHSLGI